MSKLNQIVLGGNQIPMLIASLILLLFITGLLLAPVRLHVHSRSEEVYVNVWNMCYARLLLYASEPAIQISIFSWKKILFPFRPKKKKDDVRSKISSRKKWKRPSFLTFRRMKKILSSFTVKEFSLDLDSRDVVLNAYLFPVSHLLRNKNISFQINNANQFRLDLVIENRLGNVLKALIQSFINNP